MNRERDIERVLDAWLQPGPTVMPDRLFDDVLERIEHQPQRRLARLQLRFSTMRPITILAAAAAIAIAVGAGVVLLGRPATPDAAAPTAPASTLAPAPSATTAPSATPASALPPDLAHIWIGAPRAVASAGTAEPVLVTLDFDPTVGIGSYSSVALNLQAPILASEASVPSAGRLRAEIATGGNGCSSGDTGEYEYVLSPDGMTLELTPVEDACAPRAAAWAGTWTRSDCRNPDNYCLGAVPAGSYVSTFLDARSPRAEDVSFRGAYGQLRYTVPDGWANGADWPDAYSLVPADEYAGAVGDPSDDAWHGIDVRPRPAATALDDEACSALAPGVGTSAADLAAWIAGHPALEASAPAQVPVGDLTGTMVDVRLRDDWTGTCPDAPTVMAGLLSERSTEADSWSWGISPDEPQRLVFVDIGPGQTVLIGIGTNQAPAQARFDELVSEAMPIIATFEFPEPE